MLLIRQDSPSQARQQHNAASPHRVEAASLCRDEDGMPSSTATHPRHGGPPAL